MEKLELQKIKNMHDGIDKNSIIRVPDYQRNFIWSDKKQRALIETLLLDFIIPPISLSITKSKDEKREFQIVDGQQRITTLIQFLNSKFSINWSKKTIKYYAENDVFKTIFKETDKKKFEELQEKYINKILNYEILYWDIKNTDSRQIADIFQRMNQNTTNLNIQEIRESMYSSDNLNNFLQELKIYLENFFSPKKILTKKQIDRKIGNELFLIIYNFITKNEINDESRTIDTLLDNFSNIESEQLNIEISKIKNSLNKIKQIYENFNNINNFFSGKYYFLIFFILMDKKLLTPLINENNLNNSTEKWLNFIETNNSLKISHCLLSFYQFSNNINNIGVKQTFTPIHTKGKRSKISSIDTFLKYFNENYQI